MPSTVAKGMKQVSTWMNGVKSSIRSSQQSRTYAELTNEAISKRTNVKALPAFNANGQLPAGVHDADLGSFLLHVGTNPHRTDLYRPFAERALKLQARGVQSVYVGGSGVSAKPKPGDVDALYVTSDANRFPLHERASDWLQGTHWHAANRRHSAPQTAWGNVRPTWLEYFSNFAEPRGGEIRPQAVVRVVLDDALLGQTLIKQKAV